MKASHVFFAALLGLGVSSSAFAQTTVPGTNTGTMGAPGMSTTPGVPNAGTNMPGQTGTTVGTMSTGTLPSGAATPIGTTPGTIYNAPAGTTTTGDVLTPGQSVGTPSSSGTRSTRRARTTNTTTPVRP